MAEHDWAEGMRVTGVRRVEEFSVLPRLVPGKSRHECWGAYLGKMNDLLVRFLQGFQNSLANSPG